MMDMISPGMYIFVIFIAGIAGFIDAVAGGGGVITLPAYMFAGIPPHNAYAINKLAAVTGSVTAAVKYIRGGAVDIKVSVIAAAGSAVGGLVSAGVVMLLSDRVLEILVFIAIPLVALAMIFHKNDPDGEHALRKLTFSKVLKAAGIGLAIGAYDGLIGSGVGTFAIIAFASLMHYDYITAGGNSKVINVASNAAALATFILNGLMIFSIAVPCAIAALCGSWIGSKMALKNGAKIIRPMMFAVVAMMMIKMIYDMIAG